MPGHVTGGGITPAHSSLEPPPPHSIHLERGFGRYVAGTKSKHREPKFEGWMRLVVANMGRVVMSVVWCIDWF